MEDITIYRLRAFLSSFLVLVIILGFSVKAYADEDYWPYSTNTYAYTPAEFEVLAKAIDCEARGERMSGKIAVGNVIMNRVFVYNSSITAIVTAPGQFAYDHNRVPTADSYEAARRVLDGEKWVVPQNAYYFRNYGGSTWSGKSSDPIRFWGKIGNHYIYVRKLEGRYNGNDVPAPMYSREYDSPRLGIIPSDKVIEIQQMLVSLGYAIEADGYFGELTDKAVKDFQSKNNLTIDGIVGDETYALLYTAAEATGLFADEETLTEMPMEAKALFEHIGRLKVMYHSTHIYAYKALSVYRINLLAERLRSEYGYSVETIVMTEPESVYYITAP
ncbi:MAG: peptidoglycan-binding protein [Eubacteriales bacterium]